jgi:hypothetical protein
MDTRPWERWAPLTGIVGVALFVIAFVVSGSTPDTDETDEKIAAYLAGHSHQVRNITGFFLFLAGILFVLAFFAALRTRLVDAEPGGGRLGQFAFGSGIASSVLFVVAVSAFVSPLFAANDTEAFRDADIFRITQTLGYELWVTAVVVGALAVWATAAVALRTRVLPRWFAWLSVLVGVLCLFALFFIPAFIFWGWIVLTAVLLTWRRAAPTRVATG